MFSRAAKGSLSDVEHLLDRVLAIRPGRVHLEITPHVLELDELGQLAGRRGLHLSSILSQLGSNPRQIQHLVDLLLFFTDGLTEAESPGGEPFGEDRLIEVARSAVELRCENIVQRIHERISEFSKGKIIDDFTLIAIKVE